MKYLLWLFLSLALLNSAAADSFTLVLVRHAEKAEGSNPPLTEAGLARANMLATKLKPLAIKAVYSSPYRRTEQTAQPTADLFGLAIEHYDPRQQASFARQLLNKGESALVVGHSNTIPQLFQLLGGRGNYTIAESDYSNLFIIRIDGNKVSGQRLDMDDPISLD